MKNKVLDSFIILLTIILYISSSLLLRKIEILNTNVSKIEGYSSHPIISGQIFEENFLANASSLSCIQLRTITWNREYSDEWLNLKIIDIENDTILKELTVNLDMLPDNAYYKVNLDKIKLTKGKWYKLMFTSNAKNSDKSISLMCIPSENHEKSYATINNTEQAYDFDLVVYQ